MVDPQVIAEHWLPILILTIVTVLGMTLFGSLARNEQREDSDVDICVEMVPNLFNRAGVKIYLQELLGCDVDVVRMRENMNPLFKQQILKYGIRVY